MAVDRVLAQTGRVDVAESLFQIITEPEERASIAIATNLPFSLGQFLRRCTPSRRHSSAYRLPGPVVRPSLALVISHPGQRVGNDL